MRAMSMLLALVAASVLTACAAPKPCPAGPVCPVNVNVVRLSTDPELIQVPTDQRVSIVWSFDDPSARFVTGSNPTQRDGILYVDVDDLTLRYVTPCYGTNDGRTATSEPAKQYVCFAWPNSADFLAKYKVRFHDGSNNQHTVDPGVTNTARAASSAPVVRIMSWWRPQATTITEKCADSASCQLTITNGSGFNDAIVAPDILMVAPNKADVVLTWSVAGSGQFNYPQDGISWIDDKQPYVTPCWVADKADGPVNDPLPTGKYLRCTVSANPDGFEAQKYRITYHDNASVVRQANGKVQSP